MIAEDCITNQSGDKVLSTRYLHIWWNSIEITRSALSWKIKTKLLMTLPTKSGPLKLNEHPNKIIAEYKYKNRAMFHTLFPVTATEMLIPTHYYII